LSVRLAAQALPRPLPPPEALPPWLSGRGFRLARPRGVEIVLPPLCFVAAGPFLMGSDPAEDPDAYPDEQPQHAQDLPAYAIGRYPVTVAEYVRFVAQTGRRAPPRWRVQVDRPELPVTNVTWHDATAYAAWLAERTGEPWRLPTEAEWEKTARFDSAIGQSRLYPWGDTFDPARANTLLTPARMLNGIGTFPAWASPCGARELAGNVWEWTSSRYLPYPYAAGDGREDGDPVADRVTRGGAWTYLPQRARGACRGHRSPVDYGDDTGFFLVRDGPSGTSR
jgi:formylglycine-generating enzyme required for sulfatase activity